jgi:plasmid stabilization system protein ParE
MKLQITPLARNDLKEIHTYIKNDLLNPQAAINVVTRITHKLRLLVNFPALGAPLSFIAEVESDYRFLVCGNYTAFYRYDDKYICYSCAVRKARFYKNPLW